VEDGEDVASVGAAGGVRGMMGNGRERSKEDSA
jgi:hypothetical protein